jgi:hypothetical protein
MSDSKRFFAGLGLSKEDIARDILQFLCDDPSTESGWRDLTDDETDMLIEWTVAHMSDEQAQAWMDAHHENDTDRLAGDSEDFYLDIMARIDRDFALHLGFRDEGDSNGP